MERIINTSNNFTVDKKGTTIRVASLEALIIAKHRSSRPTRPQDNDDLYEIAKRKFGDIKWSLLRSLANSEHEFTSIKTVMSGLHSIPVE